jgi:hypothetical protein
MKEKTLEQSIREAAINNRIVVPGMAEGERTRSTWPMCMTCLKEVEAAEVVNVNTKSCEIRAICTHGEGPGHEREDFYRVVWQVPVAAVGADILEDENVGWAIRRAMADGLFFQPAHQFDFSSKRGCSGVR